MSEHIRRVYRIKAGDLRRLKIGEESIPDPGPQEVQIAVKSIGLNFADIFAILGLYGATPKGYFVPGLEYAGIIQKCGEQVITHRPGDRIMGVSRFGAYADLLNMDHRYVIPLPDHWTFNEGAAYLVQVLTAYYGLCRLGNLTDGNNVLIHSGAGGVGIMANRIAKKKQAYTIGTTGSFEKVGFMNQEGYDRVIVRSPNFKRDLLDSLGNRPLHLIMECIGGKILKYGFEILAPEGRMIVYGSASYNFKGNRPNYLRLLPKFLLRPKIDPLKLPGENKSIMGFNLIWLYEKVEKMHVLLKEISELDIEKPYVGHVFKFEEMLKALHVFKSGKTTGKVVVYL